MAEVYRFVVSTELSGDPRAAGLISDAQALGFDKIHTLECQDLYFIEGNVSAQGLERIARQLLSDPITQTARWGRLDSAAEKDSAGQRILEVALRPGVTDPVAEQIIRAATELDIQGVERAATGQRYIFNENEIDEAELERLARRLLFNPVIQRCALGKIEPIFPHPASASGKVDFLILRGLGEDRLLALSQERRAALDLAEMQAIQSYYQQERRDPTDVEFEMIAQTWSEHCVHKTFKAYITVENSQQGMPEMVNGILKTFIRAATEQIAAPWVRSAFVDNAGIIDFDEEYEVSFKVETHNHPSAIEPFGGANTGVGGVIRDVLGVSARPIAATDVLCFGMPDTAMEELPEGVLHPTRIRSGVVAGVQDYGNKIGIPTVNGAIIYDEGYTANPLVFCGCVGIAPKGLHPRQPQPGDQIIVLGGRTGRDGLRGATFSSMTMDAQTGEVAGASVQIGDPITEKGLIEVITRARDQRLYTAITDCGAGGLSSAVGEMSSECGATVELKDVRLKYPGLAPWEIWLSEAQERMVLAVPVENLPALERLCGIYGVELTDIGEFNNTGRLVVFYAGQKVLDLDNEFLHNGIPQRRLVAHLPDRGKRGGSETVPYKTSQSHLYNGELLSRLRQFCTASKEAVIRIYDHEVQGGTVVKPLVGVMMDGPSDACVIKPAGTRGSRGIVLSNGVNQDYGKVDPYGMALSAVDEAIRNAVAVGANPERLALLDNFCWGDPLRPETLGGLVEAARGCYDAALRYGTPFISGKDSLNNEYLGSDGLRHSIPPTLLISAIGLMDDVAKAVTMDLKEEGNLVYFLGRLDSSTIPDYAPALYKALHQAIRQGLVRSCHDLSQGGLAVSAAEMCIGGRVGLEIDCSTGDVFYEADACLLVEVRPEHAKTFEAALQGLPFRKIGAVARGDVSLGPPRLKISHLGRALVDLDVFALVGAWKRIDVEQPGTTKEAGHNNAATKKDRST